MRRSAQDRSPRHPISSSVTQALEKLHVAHVVDPLAGSGSGLWGKERVVEALMIAQRESGVLEPRLIVFAPCALERAMRGHDFPVDVLDLQHRRLPTRALPALRRALRRNPSAVVHTHGYKANIVGRVARTCGLPMRALVATCHGWPDETRNTKFYNAMDRRTAFLSDVITVPDAMMLDRFPRRTRRVHVANAIPDIGRPTPVQRAEARVAFGFPSDRKVFGFLGRTSAAKGLREFLEAARQTTDDSIVWAIGGTGDLADEITSAALPNVRFFGYVSDSEQFLAAIDVFVQTSHSEALSLSLLEAMRAGLPIIATDVGSTALAARDGIEAHIIAPADVPTLVRVAQAFSHNFDAAAPLGAAARTRFIEAFRIERQHLEFLELYRRFVNA